MAQAGVVNRGAAGRISPAQAQRRRMARFNLIMLRLVGILVVVCLFVYISRMASISAQAKEINQIRQEITKLEEDRQYLEVLLAARQDLNRVRDEAMGRLGMSYPTDDQVFLISLSGYASAANTQTVHDTATP